LTCGGRFTTYERVQPAGILVVKKDGRREEFSRDKLLTGLRKACAKRPLEAGALESLVEGIESAVLSTGRTEIDSRQLGELVMDRLQDVDQIAYVRFACVYRDFADIDAVRQVLDDLQSTARGRARPREQLSLLPEEDLQQMLEPPRILPIGPDGSAPVLGPRRFRA
jgi:transcriptional repressor NrdR